MLYVFIVSSGSILKFDLAVKKVSDLKAEIERSFQIPLEGQVLLCSGGGELQDDNIVGTYSGAGTDTNPIFLLHKYTNECDYSYNVPLHTSIDLSIEDNVYGCADMAPSIQTAMVRAGIAERFADAAVKGRRECDELVHAQHLQQQGWAAVIANLEDGKDVLLKRKLHCEELFLKYLAKRSHFQEVIKTFPDDIELLAKIPLSPKLLLGSDYVNEGSESEWTLLSCICTQPRFFMDSLIEKYQRSLEELNEQCLTELNEDVATVLKNADNPDIKEVKGIEERLSLLNKQIEDAKKLEKDQRDLSSARHIYICEYHKGVIQSIWSKRKRKECYDDNSLTDQDMDIPEVDLYQLQVSALRRYKQHYKIQTRQGVNKAQLAENLSRHFKTIPVNEKEAITYFIYMVKNNKNKLDQKNGAETPGT